MYGVKNYYFRNDEHIFALLEYDQRSDKFTIYIQDGIPIEEYPIILRAGITYGEKILNSKLTDMFIDERIIPSDRVNICDINRAASGRDREYNRFNMLIHTMGRCSQDECYLTPLD